MCDKLHIFWVRHVAFVQLLEALFFTCNSKCQSISYCLGVFANLLVLACYNRFLQTFQHFMSCHWLKTNCQALFSPLFFVLGGCCQINENAPLPWSTMYIDYLGSSCQRQQQGRSCQSMQWILANQSMDLSELTLQPTIWKDSLIRYGRLCLAVIQPACGTCIGPLKACKE